MPYRKFKKTRKRWQRQKYRQNQIGRGEASDDEPNHPFVHHVLGKGGFGIVIGMPRLPLLSEIAKFETHVLGEKIRPLIGINATFEEYKTQCETIAETIPEGEGRELFLKLCFEVQKFYRPDTKDMFMEHIDLFVLASFMNLLNELDEISKVYAGFDTPEKKKVLDDAGILPILSAEQVDAIQTVEKSNKFKFTLNSLYNHKILPKDYVSLVENILPSNVILPYANQLEHYINPTDGKDNLWINNLFEKMMKFIEYQFEYVDGAEELADIQNDYEVRGIYPPPEITLHYLTTLFTCITFPLAQKPLRNLIDIIDGSYTRVSFERRIDAFTSTQFELMEYAKNMLAFYEKGFVHNDLKAENIMMDHTGSIKFIDFGAVASTSTSTQSIHLNVGSFKYQYWSFINVLRRVVDEDLKHIPFTPINMKRAIMTRITEGDIFAIRDRLSYEIRRVDNIAFLGRSRRFARLSPVMENIKILRNTILDAYLLDPQLNTGKDKNLRKVHGILVTALIIFANMMKHPETGEIDPLQIRQEITLRNDVYSLGIVFVEYANALANLILNSNGRVPVPTPAQEERYLRFLYEYLRFAAACMSIDIRIPSSVWLPKLQALEKEIREFLNGTSVTLDGIHSIGDLLPGEFPLTTKESVMTDDERITRETIQQPKLSDLLSKPLTDPADFRRAFADAQAMRVDPSMFNEGYAVANTRDVPPVLIGGPTHIHSLPTQKLPVRPMGSTNPKSEVIYRGQGRSRKRIHNVQRYTRKN